MSATYPRYRFLSRLNQLLRREPSQGVRESIAELVQEAAENTAELPGEPPGLDRQERALIANVLRLRNVGIPTVGFTWYSLTDQVDWDTALREKNGNVNPLGLYDLDRNIRNVGRAYKQLIKDWRDVLPASSVCLAVPIKPLGQDCWPPMVTPPRVDPGVAYTDVHPGTEAA